ncbi:hypothetical protein [Amycolatopsis sp. NPDC059021]|uniref:hypothetical protein n=1 Tax=Amycolatopsis sp. NPDC059021 TaxID=3346704 RepID=UPI00366A8E2D
MTSAEPPTHHPGDDTTAPAAGALGPGRELTVPVRPGTGTPSRCPWGCRLDVGGVRCGWSQDYGTPEYLCEACHALPEHRGRWAQFDTTVTNQVTDARADPAKLQIVVTPPAALAGPGTIELRWGTTIFGHITVALCPIDRCAIFLDLLTETRHRRRGVGRVLVAAARARGSGYRWTSLPRLTDAVATAFWARVGPLGPTPAHACGHHVAAGTVSERYRWTRWW